MTFFLEKRIPLFLSWPGKESKDRELDHTDISINTEIVVLHDDFDILFGRILCFYAYLFIPDWILVTVLCSLSFRLRWTVIDAHERILLAHHLGAGDVYSSHTCDLNSSVQFCDVGRHISPIL